MGLIERVIRALIYIALLVLAFYLIVWALAALGIALPPMVVKVLGVILVLLAVLAIVRLFAGGWPEGWRWFP